MIDIFQMGTHAPYVWSAYAVTVVLLLGIGLYPAIRRRRVHNELQRRWRWEQDR